MSLFLNQILYNNNTKFESFESIKLFEPYMYVKYIDTQIEPPLPVMNKIECLQIPKNQNVISPKNMDTLFWCMYIAKNEYGEYLNIGSKYKNKEIEIKQGMIEIIKKNPGILKTTPRKITNVAIQEIMAELMIDKKTSFKTFFAMCVLNALNIYIVDTTTQTVLPFHYNDSNHSYIFYRSVDGFFSIDIEEATIEKIQEIKSKYIELEHGDRPIKTITAYKVAELETILKQFGSWSETTKYKKQDLYDEILTKCIWK